MGWTPNKGHGVVSFCLHFSSLACPCCRVPVLTLSCPDKNRHLLDLLQLVIKRNETVLLLLCATFKHPWGLKINKPPLFNSAMGHFLKYIYAYVNNRNPGREFFQQSTHVYAKPITGVFESSACGERQARTSTNKSVQDEFSLDSRLCCWANANIERMAVCTVSSKEMGSVGRNGPQELKRGGDLKP